MPPKPPTTLEATKELCKVLLSDDTSSTPMNHDLFFIVKRNAFVLDPEPFAAGVMGEIFKCHFGSTLCAAKSLFRDREKVMPKALEDLNKELRFLTALKHAYILDLLGVCLENETPGPILLMELCNVTLEQRIMQGYTIDDTKRVELNETTKLRYALQLAMAIDHLVECQVLHRDLKPANVMIDFQDQVKLGDFGLARYVGNSNNTNDGDAKPRPMTGETGSYRYMAPEVFSHQPTYSYAVDVYSFGMLMYYLFSGLRPFSDLNDGVECAVRALGEARPALSVVDTTSMCSMIQRSWTHNPARRPTMHDNVQELVTLTEEANARSRRKSLAQRMYHAVFGDDEEAAT